MKKLNRLQLGFALFEVLLAFGVFCILVIGFMWVMKSNSHNNKTTTTAQDLSSVVNAAINKAYSHDGYLGLEAKGSSMPVKDYLTGEISNYTVNSLDDAGYDLSQITIDSDKKGGVLFYACPPTSLNYITQRDGSLFDPNAQNYTPFIDNKQQYHGLPVMAAYGGVNWIGYYSYTTKPGSTTQWQIPQALPPTLMAGSAFLPVNNDWWKQILVRRMDPTSHLHVPTVPISTFMMCHASYYFNDTSNENDRADLVMWPVSPVQPDASKTSCYFTEDAGNLTGKGNSNQRVDCDTQQTNQQCHLICQVDPS